MRRAAVLLASCAAVLACAAPAFGQGAAYSIPADNPFVGQAGARGEIYAYGLRNPWRFTFDRANGDLLLPDVGQGAQEELNLVPAGQARRANFGWACREGQEPGPKTGCAGPFFEPQFDYANPPSDPAAVTGGYIVRDPTIPLLAGRALYADFYEPDIYSIDLSHPTPTPADTGADIDMTSSFGEDPNGKLYATSFTGGVYRLDASGPGLSTTLIASFDTPMQAVFPPGDGSRMFVVERDGRIQLRQGGSTTQFLDIDSQVNTVNEGGLLSMAFAPDYAASGRFYVYFTDPSRNIRIEEFRRSASDPNKADPATQRQVLSIPHAGATNHYGGQLQFGPDGLLYLAPGDGGGSNDVFNNAQNLGTLLGKLIRIDPRATSASPGAGGGGGAAGGGGQVVMDTRAPTLRVRIARRQRILRTKSVIAYLRTTEVGRLRATGRLVIGNASKSYKLRSARRNAIPGRRYKLRLRLTRRQLRIAARTMRRGRRVRASIRLSATDAAGNVRASRRSVRARR